MLARCALVVFPSNVVIEHEQEHEQEKENENENETDYIPKKLPPPTPDRREGRLFPPEQS